MILQIFGLKSGSLEYRDVNHDPKTDIWYIHVDQVQALSQPAYNDMSEEVVDRATLWRSGIEFRILFL